MQIIGLGVIFILASFSYKGNKSQNMKFESTLKDETLGICGEKPNCVSSFQDKEDEHYIAAKKFNNLDLSLVDEFFKTCKTEKKSQNYRHYTCTSSLFKFVDDIEILYLEDTLHYRSSSRVGYSDLGVNRKRIEQLIQLLNK